VADLYRVENILNGKALMVSATSEDNAIAATMNKQVEAILKNVSGPDGRFNLYFDGEQESGWLFFVSPTTEFRLRVAKLKD
jgi:hypothetical protein